MKSTDELHKLRHSAEHVLHHAVKELYPQILLAMGPATEDGFYFDFDSTPQKGTSIVITEQDFPAIEKRMKEIVKKDLPIIRDEVSPKKAREMFQDNPYKLEWIDEAEKRGDVISVYWTGKPGEKGSMVDLCVGPHLKSTGEIKVFKLLSVAGAYWRGDEKNKMLTRIYGTAFFTQKALDDHLVLLEEAKIRDHRKLGKDLDLFTFSNLVGKGLPLFTEKGATIWRELERFVVDEEIKRGYKHVHTPNIAKTELYRTSGHYPYYKNTMYPVMKVDDEELILRPMTCPHHFALFMSKPRSYRDLPIRYAEMASLYRYEKSGELSGLIRVREFVLADSHNFVRKENAADEINFVLDLIEDISQTLGLVKGKDFVYRLSLGDRANNEKYYDSPKEWEYGESVLRNVLEKRDAPFYEAKDEAAFYGPKIDVQMRNVLGKEDTAFTVQYDFCLPERFKLRYIDENGKEEQPIVIHRSSIGAMERSIGFLIEHYVGNFPLWLTPTQVKIIPIADRHQEYAHTIAQKLKDSGIRVEVDDKSESMQKKIRNAQNEKVYYMIIVGDREMENKKINIRTRDGKTNDMKLDEFIIEVSAKIRSKQIK
ncbi:MAG: Threonine-tRNA ligase [Candidatus Roizmanbacteria bacterium GW2011_GWA2_37_7]|uniref:Threonine--tRNA ligase n=1 Tax=Candidatus Roizmanbacteria bacterium GW2011_GWA2_37_7 TaxID=1618481 RepID=A0A0G0H1C6_9BACT|nr:MAG: Threonine-tRNA ligase [Candidatus Roizmanbacteria bacterium GW2011_GWA2_37_7]